LTRTRDLAVGVFLPGAEARATYRPGLAGRRKARVDGVGSCSQDDPSALVG
jgi:hypothetical protein